MNQELKKPVQTNEFNFMFTDKNEKLFSQSQRIWVHLIK